MKPPTKTSAPTPDPNQALHLGEQKAGATRPPAVAGQWNGQGMSPAVIHHNEFVNGALKYTGYDAAGAEALMKQLGHEPMDADSAGAYDNGMGVTIYFFKNGAAVRSVDVNQLPEPPPQ